MRKVTKTIEIGYTRPNKSRICARCGRMIPAREQSVKTTYIIRGAIQSTHTLYTCMNCDIGVDNEPQPGSRVIYGRGSQ